MNKRLQNLNTLAEALDSDRKEDESQDKKPNVPHETSSNDDEKEPKKEDTAVSVTAVSAKVTTSDSEPTGSNKKVYGNGEFVHYPDDNSKEVKPVEREMGSQDSIQDFEVTKAAMETTEPVSREMGSQDSVKDFKVTNTKMEFENPVPREMGSKDAPKKFLESYKSNINSLLNGIKDSIKL